MAEIAASDRVHLSMDFRPGDIQVINNLATLHSRTGYTDFEDPDRRRHLLRLWLVAGNAWALPDPYFERYTTRARCGRPAGIMLDGTRPSAPLDVT